MPKIKLNLSDEKTFDVESYSILEAQNVSVDTTKKQQTITNCQSPIKNTIYKCLQITTRQRKLTRNIDPAT